MADFTNPDRLGVVGVRRDMIEQFVASLSPWERLYMRQQIQQAPIKLASVEDMPPELICLFESHLDLRDVLTCQRVSRSWAKAWSHHAVVNQLLGRHFPGLAETHTSEPPRDLLADAVSLRRRKYCQKRVIEWNMNWETASFRNVLPIPDGIRPDAHRQRSQRYPICYVNGKLAWQPYPELIVVDDLNAKSRRRIICPERARGHRYQMVGVSNKLLVFLSAGPHNLTSNMVPVFNLERDSWKNVFLPEPVVSLHVDGERVAAVTRKAKVFVFRWGAKALELELQNIVSPCTLLPPNSPYPRVIFHPTDGSIYVTWIDVCKQPHPRVCVVSVAKFEGTKMVWRASKAVANPMLDYEHKASHNHMNVSVSFQPRKADSHGTYTLAIYRLQNKFHAKSPLCQCVKGWKVGDWGAITFNVVTGTFATPYFDWTGEDLIWDPKMQYEYRGPNPTNTLLGLHIWNGRLLLAMTHRLFQRTLKIYLCILQQNGTDRNKRHILMDLREHNQFIGPLFEDDERLVFPTVRDLFLMEHTQELSETNMRDSDPAEQAAPEYVRPGTTSVCVKLEHHVEGVEDQGEGDSGSESSGQESPLFMTAGQVVPPPYGQMIGPPVGQLGQLGQPGGQPFGQPGGQPFGQPFGQLGGPPVGQLGQPGGQPGGQAIGQLVGQLVTQIAGQAQAQGQTQGQIQLQGLTQIQPQAPTVMQPQAPTQIQPQALTQTQLQALQLQLGSHTNIQFQFQPQATPASTTPAQAGSADPSDSGPSDPPHVTDTANAPGIGAVFSSGTGGQPDSSPASPGVNNPSSL